MKYREFMRELNHASRQDRAVVEASIKGYLASKSRLEADECNQSSKFARGVCKAGKTISKAADQFDKFDQECDTETSNPFSKANCMANKAADRVANGIDRRLRRKLGYQNQQPVNPKKEPCGNQPFCNGEPNWGYQQEFPEPDWDQMCKDGILNCGPDSSALHEASDKSANPYAIVRNCMKAGLNYQKTAVYLSRATGDEYTPSEIQQMIKDMGFDVGYVDELDPPDPFYDEKGEPKSQGAKCNRLPEPEYSQCWEYEDRVHGTPEHDAMPDMECQCGLDNCIECHPEILNEGIAGFAAKIGTVIAPHLAKIAIKQLTKSYVNSAVKAKIDTKYDGITADILKAILDIVAKNPGIANKFATTNQLATRTDSVIASIIEILVGVVLKMVTDSSELQKPA